MNIILNQNQAQRITAILNELPIKELARVKAILDILNESNKDESNTED
jgi:hypothetical protein|tara:strand:- start:1960 stop:2103 length:144 start_codon:yes stop_codon:yes gene_type:complete